MYLRIFTVSNDDPLHFCSCFSFHLTYAVLQLGSYFDLIHTTYSVFLYFYLITPRIFLGGITNDACRKLVGLSDLFGLFRLFEFFGLFHLLNLVEFFGLFRNNLFFCFLFARWVNQIDLLGLDGYRFILFCYWLWL